MTSFLSFSICSSLNYIILLLLLLLLAFFSSSGSSSCSCYCCCFFFVDSFLTDIDECTAPTPVCGIHFKCFNIMAPTVANTTLAERAVWVVRNHWFVMAQLNLFEAKWKINADDNCQNGFQEVTVINLRYHGCHNIRRIINKNIVIWRHAPGHLNDDGNEDVNMMLIRRIRQTLRSVTALQDEWLSVDLKRFWSRVTESHQCFWVCSYFCRRTK